VISPKQTITVTVNGTEYKVDVSPQTSLLEVLRDELGLTGTKNGCGEGHCGACTVIVDGKAVRSCVYKAVRADGKQVLTIEGLAQPDGTLHPLQRAFIEEGAVQCGFCTPGMIMAAKALLDRNPRPTVEEIKKALRPNLCRCTGYASIVRAVLAASGQPVQERPLSKEPLQVVGRPVPRPDAVDKVTGKAKYAADLTFPGMLHAKVLRSAYPHAVVRRIDISRAREMPGVVTVLTAEDIPGVRRHGIIKHDWPVLVGVGEKVRYIGDALAVVVAKTMRQAEAALQTIAVDYEPLPVVDSPQAALAPDAPLVHEDGNVLAHIHFEKGNVEAGFAQADVVIEHTYHTPSVDHVFLEPEAAVAVPDDDGGITVHVASQIPFEDREQIAASLALPVDKVRVVAPTMGGAFGGKEDISVQIHVALAAYHTGRPVKLVFTRRESMAVHPKRHATVIHLRTGATRDGRLVAVQADIIGDTGAYASLGAPVMTRTATHVAGPYQVPHVQVDSRAVHTNNAPAGAFRGFGVTQAAFAVERQMDLLADALGLSPFEIRRINALREGGVTATGQVLRSGVGLLETLERVEEAVKATPLPAPSSPNKKIAWGVACAYKNVGLGGGIADTAGAVVEVREDGRVWVGAGAAEVGQGLVGVLAAVTAEVLGVPLQQVDVTVADTVRTPDGGPTTASRQSFISGNAARLAAERVRGIIAQVAAEELGAPPDTITFRDGRVWAGERSLSFAEAAALARAEGHTLRAEVTYTPPSTVPLGQEGDMHFAFGYATQAALVEVDTETGEVRVLKVVAAHDVGKALNPLGVQGQIEGGVVMGIGLALREELVFEQGRLKTDNLARYRILRADQTPEIETIIVECPSDEGPFGAKGVGEIPSIPTAPAVCNAIAHACGAQLFAIPATPERVRAALRTP